MELYGKYIKNDIRPEDCDYYFETIEDFNNRRNGIITENNNDLSQKTFGFGDKISILSYTFSGTSITSTPKMIVARNITSFSYCFENCTSLTTITQGLFDNFINVKYFNHCFENCTSLTSIPQGLFDKNTNVTDFSYCFNTCESLSAIPEGLFDNCSNATDFRYCFNGCSKLTSIPQGLFDNCTKAIIFDGCFKECSSLTTVPQILFDNCHEVTKFGYCFYGDTNITSSLPDVWNKEKFPKVTDGSMYAYNCAKASNYNEIPSDFK